MTTTRIQLITKFSIQINPFFVFVNKDLAFRCRKFCESTTGSYESFNV